MDILENNIIGNFIYGLGVQTGARGSEALVEPVSVNLLQQGPLDTTLGDVLVANARMVRLIEFKRELNKSPKERAKFKMLMDALRDPNFVQLEPLSRRIHWFVLTNYSKAESTSIAVPYLDQQHTTGDRDLTRFIREIADDMHGRGMSEQELQDVKTYLTILGRFAGSRGNGSTSGTVGGLLFTVNAQGEVQYLLIENVRELAMEPREVIAKHIERQRAIEAQRAKQELEQQQELEQRMRMSPSRGLSLGW